MPKTLRFLALYCLVSLTSNAQYCTPTISNQNNLHITFINFGYTAALTNGQGPTSANTGYSQVVGSSSGTVNRHQNYSIWIQANASVNTPFTIAIFGDVNNDGDFSDPLEELNRTNGTIVGGQTGTSYSLNIPAHATTGSMRIRVLITTQGSTIDPCGTVYGEVEDYILTVRSNTAPVLNTSGSPFLNPLEAGNTTNDGMSIPQLLNSTNYEMITDGNDGDLSRPAKALRGIAITAVSATNGTWQWRNGKNGTWQNISGVAESNALLLTSVGNTPWYYEPNFIRFLPTAPGTPSFSFRAWDGSEGLSGTYYNITATGGSTAFSDETEQATVTVDADASGSSFGQFLLSTPTGALLPAAYEGASGKLYYNRPSAVTPVADNAAVRIQYDAASNKFFLATYEDIYSWETNASSFTHIVNIPDALSGFTVADKVVYGDYAPAIHSVDKDGANPTILADGNGTTITGFPYNDITEMMAMAASGNTIFGWMYNSGSSSYDLLKFNTDGTGFAVISSTTNFPYASTVRNGHVYWIEEQSPNSRVLKVSVNGGTEELIGTRSGQVYIDIYAEPLTNKIYLLYANASGSEIHSMDMQTGAISRALFITEETYAFAVVPPTITLPVSVTQFFVSKTGGQQALLQWETTAEVQNSHYTIEKSTDGAPFVAIGQVASAGSGEQLLRYQFKDMQANGLLIRYQLWQTDLDGKRTNLGTRVIRNLPSGNSLYVYPNPARNTIHLQTPAAGAYDILITDLQGRTVLRNKFYSNGLIRVNLPSLPGGQYYIRSTDKNGVVAQQKIIIQ
ncbi:GEVED domain-containing protein [Parasegetibacter sp. NRK P23]|uniref:GEVED domain-containing protein n=1 Tax=Parasegetibacter sp. NRK P23 TaxID=2942999 RepID=UPI002044A05D|nr:GEVED domain-containing protein [Parasegetibacter sp. NRK P23]MCM5530508.1 T9SS type A sorting domain-containing protein [Parasegetibacter sp. NRK P23]